MTKAFRCLLTLAGIIEYTLAQSASTLYTPTTGACPADFQLVRLAGTGTQTLSPQESAYVSNRRSNVLPVAFKTYLDNVLAATPNSSQIPEYVSNILGSGNAETLPTVGIASSGGAYRAAMFGAGVLNALDGRNESSVQIGTGGLLQGITYLSGLSGGSWLVTSLAIADFPTVQHLLLGYGSESSEGYNGWNTEYGTLAYDPSNGADGGSYLQGVMQDIRGKYEAGWPVTIVDVIARTLSRHFLSGTTEANFFGDENGVVHGAGVGFSAIQNVSTFRTYEQPFPIVIADSWSKTQNDSTKGYAGAFSPLSNVIYEFNPYEMGSYDPLLSAFTPMEYVGTTNDSVCVTGFQQAAFVMSSSSDYLAAYNASGSDAVFEASAAGPWLALVNETFNQPGVQTGVALYPNSFYGVNEGTFLDAQETYLSIVDGGEDGEAIPIQPLLVKARGVDTIIAIDVNAEVNGFADGSCLIDSQNRTTLFPEAYSFPPVPTNAETFITQNLATRPTFFGCDSAEEVPFVIYMANGGPPPGQTAITNTTGDTFDEAFAQAVLAQTFDIATQGRSTDSAQLKDPEWPACLACAVVDRTRAKLGAARSGVCASCFERYCWSGDALPL